MSSGESDRFSEFDDDSGGKTCNYAFSAKNISDTADLDTNRERFLPVEIQEGQFFLLVCTQLRFGNCP
jgi:hypothetical protein